MLAFRQWVNSWLLVFACLYLHAQAPTDLGFGPPMHLPLHLSGTFGEPRGVHFHSGIDIRTNERIGYPVLAVADGTLSRIRVSPVGYGKAMYINHPNGYTTVYGHLDRFAPALEKYIRNEQNRIKNYTVDMSVPAGTFRFKKGDTIAWSGNSGSSGGPHLHFEIRETKSEWPLNPLLYGYKIKDTQAPVMQGLYWYDLSNYYGKAPVTIPVKRTGSNWIADTLHVPGNHRIGIGWKGYDPQDGIPNKNGLFSLEMLVDDKTYFRWQMQRFSFDETRYAGCHVDFKMKQTSKGDVYHCFRLPGNRASILDASPGNGVIQVRTGDTLRVKILAKDINSNTSEVAVVIIGTAPVSTARDIFNVWPQKSFQYTSPTATVSIPGGTFYDSLALRVSTRQSSDPAHISDILVLHDDYVPLHRDAEIKIKAGDKLPASLYRQTVIVHQNFNGKESAVSTKQEGGWFTAQTRNCGSYFLKTDTQKPVIQQLKKDANPAKGVQFKISDDLSGIDKYAVYLNGKWVIAAYDAKNDLLTWEPEEKLPEGKHLLKVDVSDAAGNINSLTLTIQL
jgi:hypothetical protein